MTVVADLCSHENGVLPFVFASKKLDVHLDWYALNNVLFCNSGHSLRNSEVASPQLTFVAACITLCEEIEQRRDSMRGPGTTPSSRQTRTGCSTHGGVSAGAGATTRTSGWRWTSIIMAGGGLLLGFYCMWALAFSRFSLSGHGSAVDSGMVSVATKLKPRTGRVHVEESSLHEKIEGASAVLREAERVLGRHEALRGAAAAANAHGDARDAGAQHSSTQYQALRSGPVRSQPIVPKLETSEGGADASPRSAAPGASRALK